MATLNVPLIYSERVEKTSNDDVTFFCYGHLYHTMHVAQNNKEKN